MPRRLARIAQREKKLKRERDADEGRVIRKRWEWDVNHDVFVSWWTYDDDDDDEEEEEGK